MLVFYQFVAEIYHSSTSLLTMAWGSPIPCRFGDGGTGVPKSTGPHIYVTLVWLVGSILRIIRADADLYKRIGTRVSLPPLAVAQGMEVTVGKGRGVVALTLTLTLKDASYH